MQEKGRAAGELSTLDVVRLLTEVAETDTLYRDLYLGRASALLSGVLSPAQYRTMKDVQRNLDQALKQSKAAAMAQDWQRVEELTRRAEDLRAAATQNAAAVALGEMVYAAAGVAIDPFSPGFESLQKSGHGLAELRDALVAKLAALARADATLAALCESRRPFFSGLSLPSKQAAAAAGPTAGRSVAEIERIAFEAAQRGDVAQLRQCAQDILKRQREEAEAASKKAAERPGETSQPTTAAQANRCPVDLAAPFADDVVQRARALGFATARMEPVAEAGPIIDYVATRLWQIDLSDTEAQHEGAMRAAALIEETGWPAEVSEPVKLLVGQFLRTPFINSGGARYVPPFAAETVLIEDFPEDVEPPAPSELLSALGLERRRALARATIEGALLEHGGKILESRLGLNPMEFRLVCVPTDLYTRFGRDHGWGRQQQWTHFDGYHVLKGGALRALIGGDVRYGGLYDLASIAAGDERDGVLARFAVIRRARQVIRWR